MAGAEEVIWVESEEEIAAENAEVERKWRRQYTITSNIRYWERRVEELFLGVEAATRGRRWRERDRLRVVYTDAQARLAYWLEERRKLAEDIITETDRVRRKKVKIPEELIGIEDETSLDIYYSPSDRKYKIRDPETRELIREENKIAVEWVGSIKTERGHQVPVVCEIMCICYVREMGGADVSKVERELEAGVFKWLLEKGWGNLIGAVLKEGILYNGETIVEEKGLFPFDVPDYPKAYVLVEKTRPTTATYSGEMSLG